MRYVNDGPVHYTRITLKLATSTRAESITRILHDNEQRALEALGNHVWFESAVIVETTRYELTNREPRPNPPPVK